MKRYLILVFLILLSSTLFAESVKYPLVFNDPVNDDKGPGTYVYPTDAVFKPGSFDLTKVVIDADNENVYFKISFRVPIENPWGSPLGLSIQTIHIYIDKDGKENSGFRDFIPGVRAQTTLNSAWDMAILVEGWPTELKASVKSAVPEMYKYCIFPAKGVSVEGNTIIIPVPKKSLGGDFEKGWGFQVFILGQEGFPTQDPVSCRIREVLSSPQQWRFGGGDDFYGDPNIIDLLDYEVINQYEVLSKYKSDAKYEKNVYAQIPFIYVK
uniref:Pullulanase n=1 Tax=Dictyoglomus thermophilum TaxID=14 RepID=A0A7C3MQB6_DICTH